MLFEAVLQRREEEIMDHYVVLDIETTGLNPEYDRIIEIGALRDRNNKVFDEFSCFVNPDRKIPDSVIELTGITDDMLEGQPNIEQILKSCLYFLGDDVMMGHNILFDYSFLKYIAIFNRIWYNTL